MLLYKNEKVPEKMTFEQVCKRPKKEPNKLETHFRYPSLNSD
jgi:hypothetical protein